MHTAPADSRFTPQRRAVFEVLQASVDHPSAADVLARVRKVAPGIGAATVYRSLAHLVATGHAVELSVERGPVRYDGNTGRHDHLICDRCGSVCDIDLPTEHLDAELGSQVDALATRIGFTVTAYDLRFRGLCSACSSNAAGTEPDGP